MLGPEAKLPAAALRQAQALRRTMTHVRPKQPAKSAKAEGSGTAVIPAERMCVNLRT